MRTDKKVEIYSTHNMTAFIKLGQGHGIKTFELGHRMRTPGNLADSEQAEN